MKLFYFRYFLLIFFAIISFTSKSQLWVEMMKNPNANFYETQAEFEAYWAGKTIQKGKGYKAFKRWEHYMKPRVYPSGDVKLPSKSYTNYKQWEADLAAQGIPKSTNGNWSIIGPIGKPTGGGAGRLNFIRFDPTNSNTIWVGAPDGGLWKTTNGGTSWTTNTDQLSTIGVSDVAIDPTNTQTMYLATGDSDGSDTWSIGLLKSTDGGNTWNTTGLTWATNLGRTIGRVLVNPSNPQTILVFASNGIHRSTNGGSTFTQVSTTGVSDGEFKPGDPNTVYACGTTFRRSTDGGVTWTAVTLPLTGIGRLSMAVSAGNSAYVYLLAANNTDNGYKGLMRSTNSGTSFTSQSTTPNILGFDNGADAGGQGWYDLAIAVSPTNAEEVIIGGINHWRSTNGGSTWTMISHWYGGFSKPYVHADVHDIQFLPGSGTTILSANDGGFFKTTNSGSSWTDLSSNLAIAQQYRFSLSTSSASMILAGHQDNGTNRTINLTAWTEVGGGDGMDCFIDRTNNNRQISSIYYGDYSRTLTGGATFADITDPAGQGEWVSPIHQDPVDANIAYTGGRAAFYKTSNIWATSVTWTTMGTPPGTGSITEFAIAPSNNQVIYALKDGTGGVSKSTNGGTSFTSCATPTTAASPTWVAVSNTDPNVVFVVYSGYSATNKVKKSINGGTSWTDISSGLPNVPVNCIVYHNGATGGDGVYIGTDVGVYYRDNSTNGWIDFSSGLPNCAVSDLEIYYATNRLRAATFGRGTWDSDLYSSVPTAPVASFTANNTTICVGQSVQFTNTSTGQPTTFSWTFTGGTPATSTAQNPTVTYNTAGTYNVSLTVSNANGSNTSTQTGYITVLTGSGSPLPLTEGFTTVTFPPTGWTSINTDGTDTTWMRSATVGNAPTAGNSMVFLNWAKDDTGNQDEMRTPKLNFTGLSAAQMTFDVAYAAYNATYMDGLEVLITTDCGTTWTSLYNKTGSTVAAGNLPTAAATTASFVPTAAQWRTETINLNTYINNTNVQLAFRNLAGYGNNLYVDNINITGTAVPTAPTASFTSTPTGTACTGQTVQYTSTSTGSPSSYSWTFAGGTPATSTAQNPTVTYSTAGTYNVSLTATNSIGSNTSNQTNYITINQTPSISGTTPGSRCGTGTVSLGASASTGTISWFSVATGGTALGTGTTFTTPSISANTTYYAEVTLNGCTSARTAVLATINTNPTVNAPATQNVCLGSPSATVNFTGNSGNTIYNWTNSNTAIGLGASGTGNISSFTPSTAGTATITVTPTLASCTGTPVTFTINVNPNPTVTFDLSSVASPCSSGSSINLPTGSPTGGTYSGTGVTGNTFNPTTSGVGTFPITYSVTQNGCTGSAVSSITVTAPPTVTFDLSSVSSPCVTDAAITLPSGTPAGGTYSGTGVSGNTFNPATAGVGTFPITYSVTQNGCTGSSSSSIVVDACSELNENDNNLIVIYPNPTSGLLRIQGLISDVHTIQLIDATGRICKSWNASSTEMQIDLTEFAVGSYTLKFKGMNSSFIKRIEIKR
jgi:PKD repeat protein